jgi:hypothetical protein
MREHLRRKGLNILKVSRFYRLSRNFGRGADRHLVYYDDGTNPTMDMCRQFIDHSERVIKQGGARILFYLMSDGLINIISDRRRGRPLQGRPWSDGNAHRCLYDLQVGLYGQRGHWVHADDASRVLRRVSLIPLPLRRRSVSKYLGIDRPQQHFLYENQLTWAQWAAVDSYRTTIPSVPHTISVAALERPPTPPSETEVEGPTTPRARTPAVPGQPRKTPGKNRYMVAAPEEKDDPVVVAGATAEDEMEDVATRAETPPTPTQSAKTAVSARPSRIAKPSKGRPLTAITDNRLADVAPGSAPNSMPRSKGVVKNLGTLFESIANGTSPTEGRYNLRTGASATRSSSATHAPPLTANSGTTNSRGSPTPAPAHPASSPSKLPQKIPAKRKGATNTRSFHANGGVNRTTGYQIQTGNGQLDLGLRSTRRRRSSMGTTDGGSTFFWTRASERGALTSVHSRCLS